MLRKSILLMLFPFFISCSSEKNVKNEFTIAVSIYPLYDVVKNIAGPEAKVIFVVPPGANPHSYEPVASVVKQLAAADVFIGVHPEFDGWIEDYLKQEAAIHYIIENENHSDDPGEAHAHHHEDETNPHIWLSIVKMKQVCQDLALELGKIKPAGVTVFQKRTLAYVEQLNEAHSVIINYFSGIKNKAFIQHHPAWNYFAIDYGLKIVGSIEKGHGHNPSVKEFSELIRKAKTAEVRVIVQGLNVQSSTAEALAAETGAQLLHLDTLGNPENEKTDTYIKLMRYNGRLLAAALAKVDK